MMQVGKEFDVAWDLVPGDFSFGDLILALPE